MNQKKIDILTRSIERERAARKVAEKILEDKSRELYFLSEELKKTNQKLESLLGEKSSQLKGVFENILDAYVIMDLSGNVLKLNDAAKALFEYDINEQPLNVVNLIYDEDFEYAMSSFSDLVSTGFFKNYKARIITKNKKIKWVHINASVIRDTNNQPVAAQGIVRDFTHLKYLEEQKEEILKKLAKSNKDLYEFAHVVSHDLKSPLRTIDALVSWIRTGNADKFDDETEQHMDLIEATLENMDKLISNILSYSRVDNVNEEVEVDLNRILLNIKNTLYVPENIMLKLPVDLPIIKGDGTKFQQLFQNLISNAIKFNDKEKGIVEVDFTEEDSHYQFSVMDNGIGIEKQYHDKIFETFQTLTNREDSTGIGLSIVKKIIDLYKEDIWIESTPTIGTTIFFTLKK